MSGNALPAVTFVAGLVLGATLSAFAMPGDAADRPQERLATGTQERLATGTQDRLATGTQDRLVTGIGGVFFEARDPDALREWYRTHLGLDAGPQGTSFLWREHDDPDRVGRTVWSVFPRDSDYFGSPEQRFMVNYRVTDLDRVLSGLRAAGVEPVKEPETYPYGRFAWVEDGEGNRIELWEPPAEE